MLFSLDRVLGQTAVLMGEDNAPLEVPLSMLPKGAKNGDMFWYEKGIFSPAPDKAAQRRTRVADMLGQLLKHGDDER